MGMTTLYCMLEESPSLTPLNKMTAEQHTSLCPRRSTWQLVKELAIQ